MSDTTPSFRKIRPARVALAAAALAGAAFVAAVALGAMPSPGGNSEPVEGIDTIAAGLALAGARDQVVPLTFADGAIDIVYAGAPECSHCQDFMAREFDDLVDAADAAGLDLAYMPMALGSLGVAIAAAESCAEDSSDLPARELVARSYAAMPGLSAAAGRARAATSADATDLIRDAVAQIHADLGASEQFDEACYRAAAERSSEAMTGFAETFGLTGTPGFFFAGADGSVRRATGSFEAAEMGLE